MKILFPLTAIALFASGCTASGHKAQVTDNATDRVTVGVVQKEIHLGMSGAEVLSVIGSPNIVSTDTERNEVWVYDKLATDVVYSDSTAGVLGLIFGPIGGAAAGVSGTGSSSSGARSTSQRTLTVVINFDTSDRVSDFAYHTSRF
jgi:hypothetical protein